MRPTPLTSKRRSLKGAVRRAAREPGALSWTRSRVRSAAGDAIGANRSITLPRQRSPIHPRGLLVQVRPRGVTLDHLARHVHR
jgi:hypothetical protein